MNNLSIVSEVEVLFKPHFKALEQPLITGARQAYLLLKQAWNEGTIQFVEEFKIILLDNGNRIMGIVDIAKGGKTCVTVDIRVIFAIALKSSASKIIMAHNHPSGQLMPSQPDISITTKAKEAGRLLDIKVYDHLIITADGYYSFEENGQL